MPESFEPPPQNRIRPEQLDAILDGQGHDPCPGVEITFDVDVRSACADGRLHATIFRPEERPAQRRPGLLTFHGGGYQGGNPNGCGAIAKYLALAFGITTVSASYRLASPQQPSYPGVLEDALTAWRWFQTKAPELGADPERIILAGESAGCLLAAHLAVRNPVLAAFMKDMAPPAALVAYWGPLDLVARWFDNGERPGSEGALLGATYSTNPTLYHQASALTHVKNGLPPALFVYGRQDPVVHARQAYLGEAAWKAHGAPAHVEVVENIGHGVTGDNRLQRRFILEATGAFLRQHLG